MIPATDVRVKRKGVSENMNAKKPRPLAKTSVKKPKNLPPPPPPPPFIGLLPIMVAPATPDGLQYKKNNQGGITITKYTGGATDLVIPAGIDGLPVTEIGEGAFAWCDGLTSITVPDGVTAVGNWAFHECDRLKSVTVPDSVTAVGDGAFAWCRNLAGVTIGSGVISIGDWAFTGCDRLKSVAVPDSVRTIGKYVLPGCGNAGCRANKEARHE